MKDAQQRVQGEKSQSKLVLQYLYCISAHLEAVSLICLCFFCFQISCFHYFNLYFFIYFFYFFIFFNDFFFKCHSWTKIVWWIWSMNANSYLLWVSVYVWLRACFYYRVTDCCKNTRIIIKHVHVLFKSR